MYVESGLGSYRTRRGLSGGQMVNGVYVTDAPITTETVSSTGQSIYTDSSGNVVFAPSAPTSLTDWLNANSTMVAVGAGVFLLAIFMAKAGR